MLKVGIHRKKDTRFDKGRGYSMHNELHIIVSSGDIKEYVIYIYIYLIEITHQYSYICKKIDY